MHTSENRTGRHRLGPAGRVHCILLPAVADRLRQHRRSWLTSLTLPARHSLPVERRRFVTPRIRVRWIPVPAG